MASSTQASWVQSRASIFLQSNAPWFVDGDRDIIEPGILENGGRLAAVGGRDVPLKAVSKVPAAVLVSKYVIEERYTVHLSTCAAVPPFDPLGSLVHFWR